jgi:UDP-2,3-diacylglucosamine pyrophosphatase LpxH
MSLIKIKTLFISDIHLGNPNSQPDKVLELFKKYEFQNLIIVGDFIDMTYMKRRKFNWKKEHSTVVQKVLKLSRKGVNVVYIIGNHDFYIRSLIEDGDIKIGDISICDYYIYTTNNNERIYITHGDCFDGFVRVHPFIYWLGDNAYELSIKINTIYNFLRGLFGYKYWSLSAYLKTKVKNVVKFLGEYKKMSDIKVKEMGCDSIMIGHTHTPELIKGVYYNTGDFCESCSYIIEKLNGNLELKYI